VDFLRLLSDPNIILLQLLNGLSRSMLLFMIASGLTLILGVLRIINFAHGSLYMLGAYLFFTSTLVFGSLYDFWLSLLIVPLVVAFIGGLVEYTLLRRIYSADEPMQMLFTYGIVLVVADLVRIVWGTANKMIPPPSGLSGSIPIGDRKSVM
jgi:branched-subunit amino acid ABC-type transport system permease component